MAFRPCIGHHVQRWLYQRAGLGCRQSSGEQRANGLYRLGKSIRSIMPVYKISHEHRHTILNVTAETHEKAAALIKAQREKYPPTKDPETGEMVHDPQHYLSWHDALRMVDPNIKPHPKIPTNIVDNGHHDHGTHHTMTFSQNVAMMLERDLGVKTEFVHAVHHVLPD
jgi:hypothetical protein